MPTPTPSTTNTNTNRSVIVTGGASGLGKIMSRYFAEQGDLVTIFDVDAVNGEKVAAELDALQIPTETETKMGREGSSRGRVKFIRCDITSWGAQKDAFGSVYEDLGRVDVVVANAGVSEVTRSWMLPPPGLKKGQDGNGQDGGENGVAGIKGDGEEKVNEDLEEEPRLRVLDVNLVGTVYSVKLAQHYIQRNKPNEETGLRGSIICTASNAGMYPFPLSPLYAASKFAVVGLVRSLGPVYERPDVGIRINALAPSAFATNLSGKSVVQSKLIMTPPSTLIAGVEKLLADTSLNGQVVEIHADKVTLRHPHEVIDAETQHNLDTFMQFE